LIGNLTYVAAVVLIPLVPALILYKFLPEGTTKVSGPFKGLDIKLSGAFAGYFLVLLIVTSFVVFLINRTPEVKDNQFAVYTVTGQVDVRSDPQSPIDYNRLKLSLLPPDIIVKPNGSFSFEIPVKPGQGGGPEFPDLIVGHEDANYGKVVISLKENSPYKSQDYTEDQQFAVRYDRPRKTISIEPAIRLTRATKSYNPSSDAIAKPTQ